MPTKTIDIVDLISEFNKNMLSESVIFAGLEPMLQFKEIINFVNEFRKTNHDDIVIYTGYYPNEIRHEIFELGKYPNIIVKFGRFVINSNTIYDDVLHVELASENQYAVKIS